jgi:hypothetical protein
MAERDGGHPLGEPERACITRHRRRSSADRSDRAREPPKRCGQACWRARSPACCAGAASMPARSKATNSASLHSAAVLGRRVRPARTVSANTCCRAWRSCPGSCDPGRLLLWYESQPGAEVASLREACAIADRRHHGTRDDRADPRHCHHPLASLILFRERFDVSRHRCNALVQSTSVLDQLGDEIDYSWRQRARI